MISLVIPSYNNLRHLKNCYASIKKHARTVEVIMIDDGSNDGTWEWLQSIKDPMLTTFRTEERLGHTIQYDAGIAIAKHEVVGIFHADMIMGPSYIQNVLKHLKKGTVVCGTRVEPPIHPPGKEKIIMDFGMDFDDLRVPEFEAFCKRSQEANKDYTSSGMFAPWVIYKEDFDRVGGHDPIFAPFPYEDSDIFQRWLLAGYKLVQSRDAFVYHLTCRGHRFTEQIGVDDDYFKVVSAKAARNYIRKWGRWIQNDEYQHPIVPKKFDIGIIIPQTIEENQRGLLQMIEPWCTSLYVGPGSEKAVETYIKEEQKNTTYDLSEKIQLMPCGTDNDVVVSIDTSNFEDMSIITNLQAIIEGADPDSMYELGPMKIRIRKLEDKVNNLIFIRK